MISCSVNIHSFRRRRQPCAMVETGWLDQVVRGPKVQSCRLRIPIRGPQKFHKILLYTGYDRQRVAVYECASHALRFIETPNNNMHISENAKRSHVSLNGNLYWIRQTHEYFIQSFDFYLGDFPTRLSWWTSPCGLERRMVFVVKAILFNKRDWDLGNEE